MGEEGREGNQIDMGDKRAQEKVKKAMDARCALRASPRHSFLSIS